MNAFTHGDRRAVEVQRAIDGASSGLLEQRVAVRLRERWLLLDGDVVRNEAAEDLRAAHAPTASSGEQAAWLDRRIDQAIDASLRRADRDHHRGASGRHVAAEHSWAAWLANGLGLSLAQARGSLSAFNALDESVRRDFFDTLIEPRAPRSRGSARWRSDPGVITNLRCALRALMSGTRPERASMRRQAAGDAASATTEPHADAPAARQRVARALQEARRERTEPQRQVVAGNGPYGRLARLGS